MALVEEGERQRLRQRFSHLPEPIFNECLRTNPSNLDLCIRQLRERSQAQEQRAPMCAVSAGMEPARQPPPHPPPTQPHPRHQGQGQYPPGTPPQQHPRPAFDGRVNSDGWCELNWPPSSHPAGGEREVQPSPLSRTPETTTGGWNEYKDLYRFRPPIQVSKLSVNLQEGGQTATSPGKMQPSNSPSPSRTYDQRGSGNRTPGTPDSLGLDTSILLPDISPPLRDRTPSPSINPFFPPVDPQALRASQSNGRVSPYPGQHAAAGAAGGSPSTQPSSYVSPYTQHPTPAVVQQPNVVSSHPVPQHQLNNPSPHQDVRRKISNPDAQPVRWADPFPHPHTRQGGVGLYGGNAVVNPPPTFQEASEQTPATQSTEVPEFRQRMGSLEEVAYNQALISHQRARKDRLHRDLSAEQSKLERMRTEIFAMEHELSTKRSFRSPFPSNEQLNKLREEKRQLQIDIECMNKEIDMFKTQGFIDLQSQDDFHSTLNSGPIGPLPPDGPPAPVEPTVLEPDEGQQWSCSHCTFLNHPFLDKCECCEMPRDSA